MFTQIDELMSPEKVMYLLEWRMFIFPDWVSAPTLNLMSMHSAILFFLYGVGFL